jgi:hypothetical protein
MPNDNSPQAYRGSQLELFGREPMPATRSMPDQMRPA